MASFRHLKFKDNEKKLTMKEVIKFGLDYCYDSSELEKKILLYVSQVLKK